MDKYISLIGDEHRTALNSIWAVLRQERFEPEEVFLVLDEEKEFLDELKGDIQRLLKNYDLDCSIESTIFSEVQDVRRLIEQPEDSQDSLAALDISSASKLTTAKVLIDEGCEMFDSVFYLAVDNDGEQMRPLPTIEPDKVRLQDLKAERVEAV